MNKAVIVGRLVRDPDVRALNDGKTVSNFTVAVDRRFKNKNGEKEADFIPVVVFGKPAEFVAEYVKKGNMVSVAGRITTGSYDNKEGKKVYTTEITADEVNSIGSKKDNQAGTDSESQQQDSKLSVMDLDEDFSLIDEDEDFIPF
jgi:single-strand DNA-binding protein